MAMPRKGSTTSASHGLPALSSLICHESCVETSVAERKALEWTATSKGWLWYHPMRGSERVFSRASAGAGRGGAGCQTAVRGGDEGCNVGGGRQTPGQGCPVVSPVKEIM